MLEVVRAALPGRSWRTGTLSKHFLNLRSGASVRPAEDVLVFGYPLAGALSSTGDTPLGCVTALAGLNDDPRTMQISAAAQCGNSGGAAINDAGRVGVAASNLNRSRSPTSPATFLRM